MQLLIDVRTPKEYAEKHAEGAVNLPLDQIELGHMPDCVLDQEIVVYCRSGGRSGIAKELFEQHGFTDVTNGGGLTDLQS